MRLRKGVSCGLTLFLIMSVFSSLTSCRVFLAKNPQATATTTVQPIDTLTPTPTSAGPAGVFWVDPSQDLGEISKYTLGGNHGPWSEFSADALKKTIELGVTFIRWPGGNWGDRNDIRPNM